MLRSYSMQFFSISCKKGLLQKIKLIILASATFFSCTSTKHFLNKEEITYENQSDRFRAISIIHDKKSIINNDTSGIYNLIITENGSLRALCGLDTTAIIKKAIKEATEVSKIMNYKKNYKFIDITFYSDVKYTSKNTLNEDIACSYTVRIIANNILSAKIQSSNNNSDVKSLYFGL